MIDRKKFRIFGSFDVERLSNEDDFREKYRQNDPKQFTEVVFSSYSSEKKSFRDDLIELISNDQLLLARPSLKFPPGRYQQTKYASKKSNDQAQDNPIAGLKRLSIAFAADDADLLNRVAEELRDGPLNANVGIDLPFEPVDVWCPGGPPGNKFGDRRAAERLIGHQALVQQELRGTDVNVIIVDQGLSEAGIGLLGGTFGGGVTNTFGGTLDNPIINPDTGEEVAPNEPGTLRFIRGVTNNDHGMMIARNLLRTAPGVTVYDLPLIPPKIVDISAFASDAWVAFERVRTDIADRKATNSQERWILVNAWGIFDRESEQGVDPSLVYTTNPSHPLNEQVGRLVDEGIDAVFAAGNSGQFCPDPRCGPYDKGPGSIWGANALPNVLTVGAARADGIWAGFSSQGPGPRDLDHDCRAPDLVAPSMFTENQDRHTRNGGTSAASAMASGVLAALRQRWGPTTVTPEAMIDVLRDTATLAGQPPANRQRYGQGIINAHAACEYLQTTYP